MKLYHELNGKQRRRHRRLLTQIRQKGVVYLKHEPEFRMAQRLHRIGLVTACISKINLIGLFGNKLPKRPFKELAVFSSEAEALRHYNQILPRR